MPRTLRLRASPTDPSDETSLIVQLWVSRLLLDLRGHRQLITSGCFSDDDVARNISLGKWIDSPRREFNRRTALKDLQTWGRSIERKARKAQIPSPLKENVSRLAVQAGLSAADQRILEFVVMLQTQQFLADAGAQVGSLTNKRVNHLLSVVLGLPPAEITQSLHRTGVLVSSGLIEIKATTSSLSEKLETVTSEFAAQISTSISDPIDLLRDVVGPSLPATLKMEAFDHIASALAVVLPLLRHALVTKRAGVNVFIYGRSGTGKSELARSLAEAVNALLYEVSSEDRQGVSVSGNVRLNSFGAAQCFLRKSKAIVLFDEAEDVFGTNDGLFSLFQPPSAALERKAWINRLLETNPVPAIWLSNSASGLDPAFVRRFDVVFELPVPPLRRRAQIIEGLCADLIDKDMVARLAESEVLAPAVVARAVEVVRTVRNDLKKSDVPAAVELLISNTLEAQGHAPIHARALSSTGGLYDPRYTTADADLIEITEGLRRARQGRICLYGPPGTGKTAFGQWLAVQLEMPLETKRASDLMSKYVGDNEKNVARAFSGARRRRSILMIDEVDGFLQDRRRSSTSWGLSLVNEMLTQIEAFPGIFIGTTNLIDSLDQASLRRFDLKVHFDYLTQGQAGSLLESHCAGLGLTAPLAAEKQQLSMLQVLTPGDFATVARQSRMRPIGNTAAFISRLETECNLKEGFARRIGF